MNAILYVGEHPRTYDARWHSHSCWELIYCTDGSGTLHFEDGNSIAYHTGEVVAVPPQSAHMNSGDDGLANIYLILANPMFPYKSVFSVEDDAEKHMKNAFTDARFYYVSDLKRQELVLAALGELISSYMIAFRENREYSDQVEQIRVGITRNYANPYFKLDELIHSMPFNYDYLRKLFQKETGATPLQFMTSLRMKKARMILSTMWLREYSIAEIAESCGFADALYFSKVFKKWFGCSPSEFAKNEAQNRTAIQW